MTDTPEHTPVLTLYNSLTRKKEAFIPQDRARVTMYNCGPTVYSYAHIGNARAAVVADVLFRVLRHIYGEEAVVYARNITDVDDKIIKAAKEQGVPISDITEKYARIYNEDLAAIGCLPPTHQPKATEHISHMIAMISDLIVKGFAYESDGHVFFDVSKYDEYGQLSGNTLDALRGGDRVGEGEVARKRNAADFVLWKPELDGVGWDAPFGKGRPGWHIECSVMTKAALCDESYGNTIDIHCGGVDLKFPHHENERAQSCCANGTDKFANYWVHNEFLNMGSEKMSKSLGNVTLIHDLLKDWDGEVIRLALLKAHYRSELQWSDDLLKESKAQLDGWYGAIGNKVKGHVHSKGHPPHRRKISSSIFEDIATHLQISFIQVYVSAVNRSIYEKISLESDELQDDILQVKRGANLLGLLQKTPEEWFKGGMDTEKFDRLVADYDRLRAEALAAKTAGDKAAMGALFSQTDAIRDELKADGIVIESGPDGSGWRKA